MHQANVQCDCKEIALLQVFLEPQQWSIDSPSPTMHSTGPTPPRGPTFTHEELLVTQARLYRLLVEATDRLERERGLPRTRAPEVARLNRETSDQTNGSDSSDETAADKTRP